MRLSHYVAIVNSWLRFLYPFSQPACVCVCECFSDWIRCAWKKKDEQVLVKLRLKICTGEKKESLQTFILSQ